MNAPPPREKLNIEEGPTIFTNEIQLPPEITYHIFRNLDARNLVRASEVGRTWLLPARRAFCRLHAYGKTEWEQHIENIGDEPPLPDPDNLYYKLTRPCPFGQRLTTKDTHALLLIPDKLSGIFSESPERIESVNVNFHSKDLQKDFEECTTIKRSYWVLITRGPIPGTQHVIDHETFVEKKGYATPKAIEATALALSNIWSQETSLPGDGSLYFMRCSDLKGNVCVGSFGNRPLSILQFQLSLFNEFGPTEGVGAVLRL